MLVGMLDGSIKGAEGASSQHPSSFWLAGKLHAACTHGLCDLAEGRSSIYRSVERWGCADWKRRTRQGFSIKDGSCSISFSLATSLEASFGRFDTQNQ